jgi:hypothetical protein
MYILVHFYSLFELVHRLTAVDLLRLLTSLSAFGPTATFASVTDFADAY